MKHMLFLTFLFLLAVVAGCTPAGSANETGAAVDDCPTATAETQLVRDDDNGYCLLIPAEFQTSATTPDSTAVYFTSIPDTEHAKLFINVSDAEGRSVTEVVDGLAAGLEDFNIERTSGLLVDGEAAEMLSGVPGQELNRQLVFAHDGRIYTLVFTPDDPAAGAAYEQMQALYDLALHSFNFLWADGR